MADMPNMPYVKLDKAIGEVVSAHTAVREGVATHIQKEQARRQEEHHKAEEAQRMADVRPIEYGQLQAYRDVG